MTWLPSPGTPVGDAFAAYRTAALANTDSEFPEFAKMKRLLRGLADPGLIASAERQLGECMNRDWHEHQRWLDYNGQYSGDPVPMPTAEEAEPEGIEELPDQAEPVEPEEDPFSAA